MLDKMAGRFLQSTKSCVAMATQPTRSVKIEKQHYNSEKNTYSLSASTAESITCDEKSDSSMESSFRNSINSDANIPPRWIGKLFVPSTPYGFPRRLIDPLWVP
ncbi:hypothetical protein T11_3418 [Trichinella zimbabwensis]|uniref:Uncharacterized protein n=1 Tax=Trichinella zimbabwensis TaxID=268475 RepID=A0A0V1H395_9BILA|nr:hypothetical protein T11_3418 [Trichinella zimbabwensis]